MMEGKKGRARRCWQLLHTFVRIGAFTFGGGYAMIPLIQREAVEKRGWIEDRDVLDILAVAESTPGPIAVNAATYVGYRVAGFWGSLCATLGVVSPSFVIIALLSLVLRQFESLKAVQYAFMGIRAAVLALILHALPMAFAPAALKHRGMVIVDKEVVTKSFPGYWDELQKFCDGQN